MATDLPGTRVGQSLNAATSTGAGTVFKAPTAVLWALQSIVTGSPASATVALELSMDGVNFVTGGAAQQSDFATFSGASPSFAQYARANCTALSGGTSPTVTAYVSSGS